MNKPITAVAALNAYRDGNLADIVNHAVENNIEMPVPDDYKQAILSGEISAESLPEVQRMYEEIAHICRRHAEELHVFQQTRDN